MKHDATSDHDQLAAHPLVVHSLVTVATRATRGSAGRSMLSSISALNLRALRLLSQICITCFVFGQHAFGATATQVTKPSVKPPLTLSAVDATELKKSLSQTKAKAVVMNLWASWCAPCKSEMPELLQLRRDRLKDGVELYLISGDTEDDLEAAAGFLAKAGADFATYRLKQAPDEFMSAFVKDWPAVVPTTLLFGKNGKVEAQWYGRIQLSAIKAKLDEVLRR